MDENKSSLKAIVKHVREVSKRSEILSAEDLDQIEYVLDNLEPSYPDVSGRLDRIGKVMAISGYAIGKVMAVSDMLKRKKELAYAQNYNRIREEKKAEKLTEAMVDSLIKVDSIYQDIMQSMAEVHELASVLDSMREAVRAMQYALVEVSKSEREVMKEA